MIGISEQTKKKAVSGKIFVTMKKDDVVILEHECSNLIVDNGNLIMANLLISNFNNYKLSKFGFGDGTLEPTKSDQNLTGQNKRVKLTDGNLNATLGANIAKIFWSITYNTDIQGQDFGFTNPWPVGVPFTVREFGLFTEGGDLFNHILWNGPDLVLDTGIKLEGYFQITVDAS